MGRGDDLLHRLQGAQRGDPPTGRSRRAEAERVRVVRGGRRAAPRGRDRGGGLRPTRDGLGPADPARGSRRGPGGARRDPALDDRAEGSARRPAHPYEPHRRHRVPRGDARGRVRAPLRLLRRHGPRAEPRDAADDRREDPRPTRTAPPAAVAVREDEAPARGRAQHRSRRRRRLARQLPRRVRPHGRLGPLPLRALPRRDDPAGDPCGRASARQRDRSPHHPADRTARPDRRRPGGRVRRRRSNGDGHRDQRLPGIGWIFATSTSLPRSATGSASRSTPTPTRSATWT